MNTAPLTITGPMNLLQRQVLHDHYIVIEDPSGEFWEGSIIDKARVKGLESNGVVVIPFEPSMVHVGNGGFAKRSWGAGYPMDFAVPRMCAPLTVFCSKNHPKINWRARIMPEVQLIERVRAGETLEGMIRFASDTSNPSSNVAMIASKESPILVKQLGKLDDYDGWIIGGAGEISIPSDNNFGFGLYGMAPGVRIIWVAATSATLKG